MMRFMMRRTLMAMAALGATFGSSAAALAAASDSEIGQARLPTGVTPQSYDILVRPDAARLTFSGAIDIRFVARTSTRQLVVNAADLAITSASIDGHPALARFDSASQTLTLS